MYSSEVALHLTRAKVPVVNVSGVKLRGEQFPRVTSDNVALARLAASELLDRGFQKFAYVDSSSLVNNATVYTDVIASQYEAFRRCIAETGHQVFRYSAQRQAKHASIGLQRRDLMRWIRELPKPVGVTTYTSRRGNEIVDTCRRAGIAVPEVAAVLGGDDDEVICEVNDPPLSGIVIPSEQIGYEAAVLLHRLMRGLRLPKKPLLIQPISVSTRRSTDVMAINDPNVARPAVLEALKTSREEAIRVAAIGALGRLGEPSDTPLLVQLLADASKPEKAVARKSLQPPG